MTFDAHMERLRLRFEARAREDRARLQEAAADQRMDDIVRIAHGMSGTAGVFGHGELGEAAQRVEEAIEGGAAPDRVRLLYTDLIERLGRVGQPD